MTARARKLGPAAVLASVLAVSVGVAACGSSPADPGEQGDVVVAFSSSFVGFHSWETFFLTSEPIASSPHTSGPRTVYLNKRPPTGSTSFPVGTIIVKELTAPDDTKNTFAMVKRGGGYNAAGATDWEWFELVPGSDQAISIIWRGVGPPVGEKYGGDPNGGCNGCHANAKANDFVQATPLSLSSF